MERFTWNRQLQAPYILDGKHGDVNGDRVKDIVYLYGKLESGSKLAEDITLVIQDGNIGSTMEIPLKNNVGYNARLFLGDFTKDGTLDIKVNMETGGSGGYQNVYIYSVKDDNVVLLFDAERYSEMAAYRVVYMDDYRVMIEDLHTDKRYILDISNKKKEYSQWNIYDSNGRLTRPLEGNISYVDRGVFPIVTKGDGYDILVSRRIIGLYNADTLGYVNTYLSWDPEQRQFVVRQTEVSIPGV